ncbi:MAG: glycosyltransferase family 4 protein [Candidatus Nanopelagicales bacterium]|jgi:glycogen(starch) synthase
MRILHLSWEYPPVVYGGLGRHVHALAESQAAAGHDVVVVTQHPGTADVALDEVVGGVRVVRVPQDSPEIPFQEQFLAWVMALNHGMTRASYALGRTWRPEVVHAHDWLVGHAAANLRQAFEVPVVATMHATEAGRHQGWLPTQLSKAIHTLEWWLTFEARRVIACSQHMRWEVERLFELPPDKVDVVLNGIDLAEWTTTPEQVAAARAAHADDGPLVLFSGRLEWEKGVHTLLDAMPRLRRRFPGLRLVVVGKGSQAEVLSAQAKRLRISRSVDFAGWLTEEELRAVSAAADVAVVPSVYEPFGLVALEAAALGTPLVVADTGGLAETVQHGETGLVFPPLDAAALADAVTEVLRSDVLARRVVRQARDVLARDHDWPTLAASTVETYRRAVAEERALLASTSHPQLRIAVRDGNLLRDAT